jgi:cytoskeletal protein CcmA (bactofilin family)
MFSKSKESSTAAHPSRTPRANGGALSIIASDVVITGNIRAAGEIQLDGTVEGDIDCGGLTLGETGTLTGALRADHATIRGTIKGSVRARTVMLERSATVVGDVTHESISIEAGAKIDGRFLHLDDINASAQQPSADVTPITAAIAS